MKKIYISALTTLLVLGQMSCKKPNDFGNTNVDPGNTTKPIPSALLAQVEANLGTYVSTNNLAEYGGEYAQYFTETQYPGISTYSLPQLSFTGYYSGDLYDLQNIITLNQDKNSVAVAKILQQFIFWEITDAWGDVPYSQALQGLKAITPVYDKQEDIYKGILATLASAAASMDNGPIAGDLIYGGDAASWKRAANSLAMLVAIQLSAKVPGASDYAATAFKAADVPGSFIETNAQNFTLAYPGSAFKDPWWNLYNGRTDFAESKVVTDLTASLGDGRTVPFGGDYTDPGQVTGGTITSAIGIPPGLSRADVTAFTTANPKWALVMRADKRTETSSVVIISAAEVALARAEAANLGWTTTDPLVATYQQGIALSFQQWGLAAPAASYYTQPGVNVTVGGANNIKNISIQRYLASYPDGHAAWDIWRKSGYPILTGAPGATNPSKKIVRRFTYATSELQTNGVNVKAAIAREAFGLNPGVDSQDNRVWWDTTPLSAP
jgi:hypothetical protein